MAFKHGIKPIVTDGLVFCVDPANKVSYPGSGVDYNNLIESNTGSIENNTTFFNVDGKDVYVQTSTAGRVSVSCPAIIQVTENLSLSIWYKGTDSNGLLCGRGTNNGSFSNSDLSYGLTVGNNNFSGTVPNPGVAQFFVKDSSADNFVVSSSSTINDGNWHHIAGVYTPSTSLKLYVDGIYVNSNTTSIPSSIQNAGPSLMMSQKYFTTLGRFSNLSAFTGSISDGGISVGSTAGGDIATLYGGGSPGNASSINTAAVWYKLQNSSSPDQLSNGSNFSISTLPDNLEINYPYPASNFYFDGVDDYIDFGRPSNLIFIPQTNAFSVSAWFKTTSYGTIYSFGAGSSNGTMQYQLILRSDNYYIQSEIGGTTTNNIGATALNDGQWHYVVNTVPAASSGAKTYIDGIEVVSNGSIGSTTNTQNLLVGARTDGSGYEWIGKISLIQVYNKVLSASEVTQNYNALKYRFE